MSSWFLDSELVFTVLLTSLGKNLCYQFYVSLLGMVGKFTQCVFSFVSEMPFHNQ